jgi:hypothetical protein
MTNQEVIHKIIDLYNMARNPKFPAENIVRARSHTTSSDVEDLIAYFFSKLTDAEIIIDKPFSVKINGKRKTIYPDIAIKRGDTIVNFFDVKMDLGWKRAEFSNYCIEKSKMVKEIRGQQVYFGGDPILLGNELKYEIIVISKLNIAEKVLSKNMNNIEEANINGEVPIYFLTNKIHPNHGDSQSAKDNIEINHEQLNKLREKIKTA